MKICEKVRGRAKVRVRVRVKESKNKGERVLASQGEN